MKLTRLSTAQLEKELSKPTSKFDKKEMLSLINKRKGGTKQITKVVGAKKQIAKAVSEKQPLTNEKNQLVSFVKKGEVIKGVLVRTFDDKRDGKNYSVIS